MVTLITRIGRVTRSGDVVGRRSYDRVIAIMDNDHQDESGDANFKEYPSQPYPCLSCWVMGDGRCGREGTAPG